ncbi:AAA family ATPase [Streptomyces swartbergensis]|uniref:AAA family ATPase n=1 Tax=Streptomyces swartbergensis TaxID=487165 RepID=UPI00382905E9
MPEYSPSRELTSRDILTLLRDTGLAVPQPETCDVSDERWALRARTALLGAFDAAELVSRGSDGGAEAAALREFLTHDCDRVNTRRGRRWRLVPVVRTATLERLRTPDKLLEALRSGVPAGHDTARDCAEQVLTDSAPPLTDRNLDELHALLTLVRWLDDAAGLREALADRAVDLPEPEDVERHIERARLLQPLEALADSTFCGRERELAVLAGYVATEAPGPEPAAAGGPPGNGRRAWPLIHGPGGVGKSTLVARFALDHISRDPTTRGLLFVHLPFDRADLAPEQPLTLLGEALGQLRVLVREMDVPATRELERVARTTLDADSRAESERQGSRGPRTGRSDDESSLAMLFCHVVESALRDTNQPVLFFLDTFEQAQRKGPLALTRLLDFLEVLQDVCPWLRIVAAGRAPVADRRFTELPLEGFDPATARAFLRRLLPGFGPEYETALDSITRTAGSDPLSLKLAAGLFRREGPQALSDPALRRQVQLRLQPEEVQGVLYRRILDHLDDKDLRRIASPGLTVRRVTPDVIRRVLAAPCGLRGVDGRRARVLFHRLRDEAALVADVPGQEAVVHRADVRRVMLPMLRSDAGQVVDRIHRKAVAYYRELAETDPANAVEHRAEELYHRMCLGQGAKLLDRRWMREAGPLLDSSLEELPARSQVYLSERLGLTVRPELLRQADDETWARQVLRVCTKQLTEGRADAALDLLEERPDRVSEDVRLGALKIRALTAFGRTDEARALVEPVLELASRVGDPGSFVETAVRGARIEEDLGCFGAARSLLGQARDAAEAATLGEVPLLTVAVAELRLHRRDDSIDTAEAGRLRAEVLERVSRLGTRDRSRHPALVRELAAEVGDLVPVLVSESARQLGVDVTGDTGQVLRRSLSAEEVRDLERTTRAVGEVPASPTDAARAAGDTAGLIVLNNHIARGTAVGSYIDSGAEHQLSWNHALVNTYQHEVDQSEFTRTGSGRGGAPADWTQAAPDAVVLVPGFMGSALVDTHSGDRLWGHESAEDLARAWLRGDIGNLRLTEDEPARDQQRIRPVSLLRAPSWAPMLGGIESYDPLRRCIRSYAAHPDAVLEFPYDWRLAVHHNARLLAQAAAWHLERWRAHPAVSRSREDRGGGPPPRLVLIAHSMGGLVACAALSQDPWLAENIRSVVCLGTPFRGIPQAVGMLDAQAVSGPWPLPHRRMRELLRTWPGFYDLLPDYRCIEEQGGVRRLQPGDVERLGGDTALAREAMSRRPEIQRATLLPHVGAVVGLGERTVQSVDLTDGTVRLRATTPRLSTDGSPLRDERGASLRWDAGGDGLVPSISAGAPTHAAHFVPVRRGSLVVEESVMSIMAGVLLASHPAPEPRLPKREDTRGPREGRLAQYLPDDGGIGLPSAEGISLALPELVEAGRPYEILIRGARTRDVRVRCAPVTGPPGAGAEVAASARPLPDGDGLVARLALPSPGIYRVTVYDGEQSVSRLAFAVDPADAAQPWPSRPPRP